MSSPTLIAFGGLAIAALSLVVSIYTAWRTRRDREQDQGLQELRFRQLNEPVLMVKPQFSLAPTNNRLLIEVTNLHSSIAVQDVVAHFHSQIEFDNKLERQDAWVKIAFLKPGTTTSAEVGDFVCDFDSFVANIGERNFNRQLAEIDVARAIETVQSRGYLKNGQPPVGTMELKWQYKSAQPNASVVAQDATYTLFVWRHAYGLFLSFEWPSLSGK